jgi:hypothetical protein
MLLLIGSGPSLAQQRALLIGVGEYPQLAARHRLAGPANDVRLLADVLRARGVPAERVQVLADHLPAAAQPTRANILEALDRLGREARPGETVFVHFSGHGSRQPVPSATPNAIDAPGAPRPLRWQPILLPRDATGWSGRHGTVGNAITDVELRERLDRVNAAGAFVWATFDACHAAALVRDGPAGVRQIEPAALGVDLGPPAVDESAPAGALPIALAPPTSTRAATAGGAPAAGRAAYFYASRAHEPAREAPFATGPGRTSVHGLFTYTLAQALRSGRLMTYRQLGQHVLYLNAAALEPRATPLFGGNGLDEPVLGLQAGSQRQWPIEHVGGQMTIAAGSLAGLGEASSFIALPHPLAHADEAIGTLELAQVHVGHAVLRPSEPARTGGNRALPDAAWARLVVDRPSFALRVAVEARSCREPCAALQVVRRLQALGVPGLRLHWVARRDEAEWALHLGDRAIRHHPASASDNAGGEARSPKTLGLPMSPPLSADEIDRLAARLGADLHHVARFRNLMRVAAALRPAAEATSANGARAGVALRIEVQRHGPGVAGGRWEDITPEAALELARLRDGDRLRLSLRNAASEALDLSVLWLNARYGIVALFPNRLGEINRLEPDESRVIDDLTTRAASQGLERLVLVWRRAPPQSERADFSFLEQPELAALRSASTDDGLQLLREAVWPGSTRAAPAAVPSDGRLAMRVYGFNVGR